MSNRLHRYLLPLALLLGASPFSAALADSASEMQAFKTAIRAQYDILEQAYNNKDAETLVNKFFAEDVVVVPPGPALSVGREQAIAGYKRNLEGKVKIVSFKTYLNGDNGIDWANEYVTPDDPAGKPSVLKLLVLWEKRADKWTSIGVMFMPGAFPIPEAGTK